MSDELLSFPIELGAKIPFNVVVSAGEGSLLCSGVTDGDLLGSSRHSSALHSEPSSDEEYVAVRGAMAPEENAGVGRDTGAGLHSGLREKAPSPARKRISPTQSKSPDTILNSKN